MLSDAQEAVLAAMKNHSDRAVMRALMERARSAGLEQIQDCERDKSD